MTTIISEEQRLQRIIVKWEKVTQEIEAERERVKGLIVKIEKYVNTSLKEKYKNRGINIGLIYTKIKEDVKNHNRFMIWRERSNGLYIDHNFINIDEIKDDLR